MKNLILVILAFVVLSFSGCTTSGERKGAETLRNIHQLSLAVKDPSTKVSADEAIAVIELASNAAANNIDPKFDAPATVTVAAIKSNKLEAFRKIIIDASTLPPTDWGWLATIGGGILVAAGLVGKMMGPPWNLGGMAAEALGRRLVPKYEETKKVAVGMLVATDLVLTNYGDLLDTMPEVKAMLTEKLGQDPVKWFKTQIQKANTDNGMEPAVSDMLTMVKRHLTTEGGALAPEMKELDAFISKSLSNLKK
jgi:hypothetical protein